MENPIEIIKNLTKSDYQNERVNLHIHTKYSDGLGDFNELTSQAKEKYQVFAITDHNTVQGHLDNPNSGAITGVEFDVWHKYIFLHLLAYGIDINHPAMQKFYARNKRDTEKDIVRILSKRNLKELISAIHLSGGIAVLAHPACCWALNLEKFVKELVDMGLDGIEVYYPYPRWRKYIKFSSPAEVEKIAEKFNLIKTGGTDCHSINLN
ncbi:PHP domain-containing protein [bacterium]|nr:PHP domain-containing protein [bacterium]